MDNIKEALTFDDVLLLPKYSNVLPSNTNIFLNLTEKITLKVGKNRILCSDFGQF